MVPLDRHNFALFCSYLNNLYFIGFNQAFHSYIKSLHQNDDALISKGEEIFGFGISWVKGLLDNPGIWVSDMLFSDRDPDQTSQAEDLLEQYFDQERVHTILKVIVTEYLILTHEEL